MPIDKQMFSKQGFTAVKTLGSGHWGTTYLAQDADGNKCCIKSESDLARAQNESGIISRVYDDFESTLFTQDGTHYFTMPYFEGVTLEHAIQNGLSLFEKVEIATRIKEEMVKLYGKGYLHRDLHAYNILYNPKDKANPINLIDLGRSVALDAEDKNLPHWAARLFFQPQTAPEYVSRDNIGIHSDIFSFGLIMKRFFPGAHEDVTKLFAHYDYSERYIKFNQLETSLKDIFKQQKNHLVSECSRIIDSYSAAEADALIELRTQLENVQLDDPESIRALQASCNNTFEQFQSSAEVHWLVLMVFDLLAYFGFMKQEDVLQYRVRAFIEPGPEESPNP